MSTFFVVSKHKYFSIFDLLAKYNLYSLFVLKNYFKLTLFLNLKPIYSSCFLISNRLLLFCFIILTRLPFYYITTQSLKTNRAFLKLIFHFSTKKSWELLYQIFLRDWQQISQFSVDISSFNDHNLCCAVGCPARVFFFDTTFPFSKMKRLSVTFNFFFSFKFINKIKKRRRAVKFVQNSFLFWEAIFLRSSL